MNRGCILIVDDCAEQCASLSEFFLLRGFQAFSATNAFSAHALLRKISPSIALIDINMPDLSGIKLCEIFRNLDIRPHVILMSGDVDAVARANLTPGFDGLVIDKPLPLNFLAEYLDARVRDRPRADDRPKRLR